MLYIVLCFPACSQTRIPGALDLLNKIPTYINLTSKNTTFYTTA